MFTNQHKHLLAAPQGLASHGCTDVLVLHRCHNVSDIGSKPFYSTSKSEKLLPIKDTVSSAHRTVTVSGRVLLPAG